MLAVLLAVGARDPLGSRMVPVQSPTPRRTGARATHLYPNRVGV